MLDTGDPIPEDKDAVIMVEDIVKNGDGSITIHAAAAPWQHIRQIGEDVCAGEMILPSHMTVSPAAIGAMIAGGVLEIEVIRKPVVGIIPTGDEIIPPCTDPKPGDILEFNGSIFSAMVRSWGAEAVVYPIVPDKFDQIKEMVAKAADECDMVILNAGSSAGREDFSARVIRELGEVLYHGIAIKPGKPFAYGRVDGGAGAAHFMGLPGNPVSCFITFAMLVRPFLLRLQGVLDVAPKTIAARADFDWPRADKRREFLRVRLNADGHLERFANQSSGVLTSTVWGDGVVDNPPGQAIARGDSVRFIPFGGLLA